VRRFLTPGWLVKHAVTIVLVTAFLGLGWWQVTRAAAGNLLSYGYAVEWPLFAAFVVFVWVREIRSALRRPGLPEPTATAPGRGPVRTRVARPAPVDDDADPALAAYNRYLAWLAANPDRRPSEYRPTRPS
jgi:DNA-binding transcriptional regulator of glucitol operon